MGSIKRRCDYSSPFETALKRRYPASNYYWRTRQQGSRWGSYKRYNRYTRWNARQPPYYLRKRSAAQHFNQAFKKKIRRSFHAFSAEFATNSTTGVFKGHLDFNGVYLGANGNLAAQVASYREIYDEFRIVKLTRVFWFQDNDQLTKPDTSNAQLFTAYDPDCENRNFASDADFGKVANHRHRLITSGRKYKLQIYPVWSNRLDSDVANPGLIKGMGPGKSQWMDAAHLNNDSMTKLGHSKNGMQYHIHAGVATKFEYRDYVVIEFRGVRNGQTYDPFATDDPETVIEKVVKDPNVDKAA